MQPTKPTKAGDKGGKKLGWVIALIFALLVVWIIYTSIQTLKVDSTSMPANMPGMSMNSSSTEGAPTQMPESMPGMNRP